MDNNSGKNFMYIAGTVTALVIVVYVLRGAKEGTDDFLEFFGFKSDASDKRAAAAKRRALKDAKFNPWNPDEFDAQVMSAHPGFDTPNMVTPSKADAIAKQIYSAVGFVYDTPAQALAAIKQCPDLMSVARTVRHFNTLYKQDLLNFLSTKFDTNEQQEVFSDMMDYVSRLKIGLAKKGQTTIIY